MTVIAWIVIAWIALDVLLIVVIAAADCWHWWRHRGRELGALVQLPVRDRYPFT